MKGEPIDAETKIYLDMIEAVAKFVLPELKHIKNKTDRKIAAGFRAHQILSVVCEKIGEERLKELWHTALNSPRPDSEVEAIITEALGL